MAGQIIDSLVVTLGLDPAKFGSGAQAAQKKLAEFNKAIKDLGIDEDKLTDKQKKSLAKLRDHEVQAARTSKELKATQAAGVSLFSALEKGALGFGAALGLYSLEQFARSSITSGAALSRLSHTLGISAQAAETWGIAIKESVGGSADDVLGTLQSFGDALQGFQFNPAGLEPLRRIAAILSRANGGKTHPAVRSKRRAPARRRSAQVDGGPSASHGGAEGPRAAGGRPARRRNQHAAAGPQGTGGGAG